MISLSCLRKIPCQFLLIISVGLIVFSPALFSEFCRVDDLQMVESLKKTEFCGFQQIFLPRASGGLYYRPFLILSFFADRFVFGLSSFAMHLHNIILHLLNVLLLFFISKKLLKIENKEYPYLPLVVALFFLVHPITTESINWVSGRTDILASVFVLSCTWLLLTYIDTQRRFFLYGALVLFVGAVLTKEFAVAFLPGFILLATYGHSSKNGAKVWLFIIVLALIAAGSFFALRSLAFTSNATQISTSLLVIFNTPGRALQLVLTAIGFYMKKLFVPVPLNFAIYEVNALYEFVAWPVLVLLFYLTWKRTLTAILFVSGIALISPAMLVVFNQIAWTPYAERYLYLPVSFVILAVIYYLRKNLEFPNSPSRCVTVVLILVLLGVATVQRNITWMTAYSIVEDTIRKSPESADMQCVFASILIDRNEFGRARAIISKLKSPPGLFYDERGDLLEVDLLIKEGRRDEALRQLEQTVVNSNYKSVKSINALIDFYKEELPTAGVGQTLEIRRKMYAVRKKHYKANQNVALLYDLAQDAKNVGDTVMAERYLLLSRQNVASQAR